MSRPKSSYDNGTFKAMLALDNTIAHFAESEYTKPATEERIAIAKAALEAKGYKVTMADNRDDAFDKLLSLIPAGVSVNMAHSTTLEELGFIDYLKSGDLPFENIKTVILAEKDPTKQAELRRVQGSTVDYYLTSMSALTESGEMAHGDATGTKVGAVAYAAKNVIVIVGSNKIVKDEQEARKRVVDWCLPLVNVYTNEFLKAPSQLTHYEVLRYSNPMAPGRIQVLLIKESLGF